jgi:formylglycine-generating enzyme required for sulfatase activity
MVLVPVGCFNMGSNAGSNDEEPVHEQCFDEPFWIDRYEVTNAQFDSFGGVAEARTAWRGNNLPRNNISWSEARDYCALRGAQNGYVMRLPTEREWEYAARGPVGFEYPWGNDFISDAARHSCNFCGTATVDVGVHPKGMAWVGTLDMAGNVWEWTSSLYRDYPYDRTDGREDLAASGNRVLRGGSWNDTQDFLRAANRNGSTPDNWDDLGNGLRCARSPERSEG